MLVAAAIFEQSVKVENIAPHGVGDVFLVIGSHYVEGKA